MGTILASIILFHFQMNLYLLPLSFLLLYLNCLLGFQEYMNSLEIFSFYLAFGLLFLLKQTEGGYA